MIRDEPSESGRSRAQTAQDFAVGIGLFLIAVAFVFTFVPDILEPYDAGAGGSESAQADRAATVIVGNLSVDGRPNELSFARTETYFDEIENASDQAGEIRNRTGLPFSSRVNVTMTEVTTDETNYSVGGTELAVGDRHHERFGGRSATRIVRTNDPGSCVPACRLVVRVW